MAHQRVLDLGLSTFKLFLLFLYYEVNELILFQVTNKRIISLVQNMSLVKVGLRLRQFKHI